MTIREQLRSKSAKILIGLIVITIAGIMFVAGQWHTGVVMTGGAVIVTASLIQDRLGRLSIAQSYGAGTVLLAGIAVVLLIIGVTMGAIMLAAGAMFLVAKMIAAVRTDGWSGR